MSVIGARNNISKTTTLNCAISGMKESLMRRVHSGMRKIFDIRYSKKYKAILDSDGGLVQKRVVVCRFSLQVPGKISARRVGPEIPTREGFRTAIEIT